MACVSEASGTKGRGDLLEVVDVASAQRVADFGQDPEARANARDIYYAMMSGLHPDAPSLKDRMRLLHGPDDRALLLHVAVRGSEAPLRAAALALLDRARHMDPGRQTSLENSAPFGAPRPRSILRRSIVTTAYEIERALTAGQMLDVWARIDALEQHIGDWPFRWPLPGCVVRVCELLQQAALHDRLMELHVSKMSFNIVCDMDAELVRDWWGSSGFFRMRPASLADNRTADIAHHADLPQGCSYSVGLARCVLGRIHGDVGDLRKVSLVKESAA